MVIRARMRRCLSTLIAVLVGVLVLGNSRARAASCGVKLGSISTLYKGTATTVRAAWERVKDGPVVMWLIDNHKMSYRYYTGSWMAAEAVDLDGIYVPSDHINRKTFALAVDGGSMPHVVIAGERTKGTGAVNIFYLRKLGASAWSKPVQIATLPTLSSGTAIFLEADFDSIGRLHVVYNLYGPGQRQSWALYRQNGVWKGPTSIGKAVGLDMAVGPKNQVHAVSVERTSPGNRYQAFYKRSNVDGTWPSGSWERITWETPTHPTLGPVGCWAAVDVDRNSEVHVAYPVDPASTGALEGGHVMYMKKTGSINWKQAHNNAIKVLTGTKTHTCLPMVMVDPVGVVYVLSSNIYKRLAVYPVTGTFLKQPDKWHTAHANWYRIDLTATGEGGWVTWITSGDVFIRQLIRTGSCATGPQCNPNQTRVCGNCGTQKCGSNFKWGACAGQGTCMPEAFKSQSCGNCGTQKVTCNWSCSWGSWGICQNQGCTPGQAQTQPCAHCGTQKRICDAKCQWGPWGNCSGCPSDGGGTAPIDGRLPQPDRTPLLTDSGKGHGSQVQGGCDCGLARPSGPWHPGAVVLFTLVLAGILRRRR